MTYTLNYADDFNEVKSMNTANEINLIIGKDGVPFDLSEISDNTVTIKIANQDGYIRDLPVDISEYTADEKLNGSFTLQLNDDFMHQFPPDIYYLETWVNTKGGDRIIFPSDDNLLTFTINPNEVNDSDAIPMVTFYQVRQDWENTKQLIITHEAKIEKYINSLTGTQTDIVNDIKKKINDYYKFSNNIKNNLNRLNSTVFNESHDIDNKLSNIKRDVSQATSAVSDAGNNVRSSFENIVSSAKSNINKTIDTNSALTLINSGAIRADSQVSDVVNSAKNNIGYTSDSIKDEVQNIVTKGNDQVNIIAGSSTRTIASVAQDTMTKGYSANSNVSSYASSFDDHISQITDTITDDLNSTRNSYSQLNQTASQTKASIRSDAASAYSNIDTKISSGTDQMVSKALNSLDGSLDNNSNYDKAFDSLSVADSNFQDSLNYARSVEASHHDTLRSGFYANHKLIKFNSSIAMDARYNTHVLSSSNIFIERSLSSLSNTTQAIQSASSSEYKDCLTQANSYTDSKFKSTKNNSSNTSDAQIISDANANNLVFPLLTGKLEFNNDVDDPVIPPIKVERGKSYWFSCHVETGTHTYICSDWLGQYDPIDEYSYFKAGQDCVYHWTATRDGEMPLNVGDEDYHCVISHLCVTQSKNFIPFNMAEKNRNAQMGLDLYKPNLLPITQLSAEETYNDYRIFNIPVRKNKTYWISGITDPSSDIDIRSPKNGNMDRTLTSNCYYNYYGAEPGNYRFIFYWTSDITGNLPIGISTIDHIRSKIHVHDLCITETDNFIPFELAQENRENIQSVLNSVLNYKN